MWTRDGGQRVQWTPRVRNGHPPNHYFRVQLWYDSISQRRNNCHVAASQENALTGRRNLKWANESGVRAINRDPSVRHVPNPQRIGAHTHYSRRFQFPRPAPAPSETPEVLARRRKHENSRLRRVQHVDNAGTQFDDAGHSCQKIGISIPRDHRR